MRDSTNPRSHPFQLIVYKQRSTRNGSFFLYHQGGEQLFCDNETNNQRMYNRPNDSRFVKDGINNYIVE